MTSNDSCSITPDFPRSGYLLLLFIFDSEENEILGLYPLESIFTDLDEGARAAQEIRKLEEEVEHIQIPDECLLIPIKYKSKYPMRKEHWEKPSVTYDAFDRMKLFLTAARQPSLYSLLVTPGSYINEKWLFHASLPFTGKREVVENFMYMSDLPVDERAKYSAIYSMGEKMRFNFETREISEISNDLIITEGEIAN